VCPRAGFIARGGLVGLFQAGPTVYRLTIGRPSRNLVSGSVYRARCGAGRPHRRYAPKPRRRARRMLGLAGALSRSDLEPAYDADGLDGVAHRPQCLSRPGDLHRRFRDPHTPQSKSNRTDGFRAIGPPNRGDRTDHRLRAHQASGEAGSDPVLGEHMIARPATTTPSRGPRRGRRRASAVPSRRSPTIGPTDEPHDSDTVAAPPCGRRPARIAGATMSNSAPRARAVGLKLYADSATHRNARAAYRAAGTTQ